MAKRVAVIGAGIAGLSAGCYARMNGFDTTIFELHDKPGGLCTSWQRNGYVVDACIHWLCGSSPSNNLYKTWKELGAVQGVSMVDHEEFVRVEGPSAKQLIIYTNIDRLEKHLLELAPQDQAKIRGFIKELRFFARTDARFAEGKRSLPARLGTGFLLVRFLYHLFKSARVSIQEFSAGLKDPFLRESLPAVFDLPDFPMFGAFYSLALMNNRAAGYPLGGSLAFARRIEGRYVSLGGEIRYHSRVTRILVEQGRAVGVQLEDGSVVPADYVISAADGHSTLFDLLGERYLDDKAKGYFRDLRPFPPLIYISVGVDMDLRRVPHAIICRADPPLIIPGNAGNRVYIRHFGYDPSLAPAGKSILVSMFASDYALWKEISKDRCRYETEKSAIADQFLQFLDRRFPGIRDRVEMVDVATPLTFERYTANWQGSFEGWLITTKSIRMRMRKTLPAVRNFQMIGQWVQPGGGLPTGAMHGRQVIKQICRENGLKFQTTEPV